MTHSFGQKLTLILAWLIALSGKHYSRLAEWASTKLYRYVEAGGGDYLPLGVVGGAVGLFAVVVWLS